MFTLSPIKFENNFPDVELEVSGVIIKASRDLVGGFSKPLRVLFNRHPTQTHFTFPEDDPEGFDLMIRAIYGEQLELTVSQILKLIPILDKYGFSIQPLLTNLVIPKELLPKLANSILLCTVSHNDLVNLFLNQIDDSTDIASLGPTAQQISGIELYRLLAINHETQELVEYDEMGSHPIATLPIDPVYLTFNGHYIIMSDYKTIIVFDYETGTHKSFGLPHEVDEISLLKSNSNWIFVKAEHGFYHSHLLIYDLNGNFYRVIDRVGEFDVNEELLVVDLINRISVLRLSDFTFIQTRQDDWPESITKMGIWDHKILYLIEEFLYCWDLATNQVESIDSVLTFELSKDGIVVILLNDRLATLDLKSQSMTLEELKTFPFPYSNSFEIEGRYLFFDDEGKLTVRDLYTGRFIREYSNFVSHNFIAIPLESQCGGVPLEL